MPRRHRARGHRPQFSPAGAHPGRSDVLLCVNRAAAAGAGTLYNANIGDRCPGCPQSDPPKFPFRPPQDPVTVALLITTVAFGAVLPLASAAAAPAAAIFFSTVMPDGLIVANGV